MSALGIIRNWPHILWFLLSLQVNAAPPNLRSSNIASDVQSTRFHEETPGILAREARLEKKDTGFCWPLMDPVGAGRMFCQCSDYQVRPLVTQAPTPGVPFKPCEYSVAATTAISSLSTLSTSSTQINRSQTSSTLMATRDPTSTIPIESRSSPTSTAISTSTSVNLASSAQKPPSIGSLPASPTATPEVNIIPLWGPCTPGTPGSCAAPARCICQNEWYSQCRIPIDGSWTPRGESWLCPWNSESSQPVTAAPGYSTRPSTTLSQSAPLSLSSSEASLQPATLPSASLPALSASDNLSSPVLSALVPNPPPRSASPDPSLPQSSSFSPLPSSTLEPPLPISPPAPPPTSMNREPILPSSSSESPLPPSSSERIIIPSSLIRPPQIPSSESLLPPPLSPELPLPQITSELPFVPPSTALPLVSSSEQYVPSSTLESIVSVDPNVIIPSATSVQSVLNAQSSIPSSAPSQAPAVSAPPSIIAPSSSIMPYIGCPSSVVAASPLESGGSVCDYQTGNTISNLSSTANTLDGESISPSEENDPDTGEEYLRANATTEERARCMNPAAHQLRECWGVLNVTGWIYDWVAFNQAKCDQEGMGFADCFLYLQVGGGANCSSFTGRSQCDAPDARSYNEKVNGPQAYYVAFNIWNIQNWFFTYWMAVDGANGLTSNNVAAICRLLNIPLPKPFPLLEVLSVMAFALGLISPSGYGALIPALGEKTRNAFTQIQVPGEYLLRGIQGSPVLSRNLLASGDKSKTEVQIANIESGLALITAQLQTNVQNALIGIMGNFTLFMDFASDGFFSTQIDNLNTIQQNVTKAFQTYVVSQALQDDSVIITRAVDTNVHALATNGTETAYDIGCTQGYDQWGMCDNWWYDKENDISYGLENQKAMNMNYTDVLGKLFAQGITTPEMLFQGSQVCADAAGGTQGNAPGTSLDTSIGVWNAECVSNMKICTWELAIFSQQAEFTDCPYERNFALEHCGQSMDILQARVPINYIGPWLLGGQYSGIVCNEAP